MSAGAVKIKLLLRILGLLLNDGLRVKAICWDCTSVYFNLQWSHLICSMQLPNDLMSTHLDNVFEDVKVFMLPGSWLWTFISLPQAPPPAPATEELPSSQSVRMTRSMRIFVWVASINVANDTFDLSRHRLVHYVQVSKWGIRFESARSRIRGSSGSPWSTKRALPPLSQRDAELFSRRSRQTIPQAVIADFYEIHYVDIRNCPTSFCFNKLSRIVWSRNNTATTFNITKVFSGFRCIFGNFLLFYFIDFCHINPD